MYIQKLLNQEKKSETEKTKTALKTVIQKTEAASYSIAKGCKKKPKERVRKNTK